MMRQTLERSAAFCPDYRANLSEQAVERKCGCLYGERQDVARLHPDELRGELGVFRWKNSLLPGSVPTVSFRKNIVAQKFALILGTCRSWATKHRASPTVDQVPNLEYKVFWVG